jgi:hypothetical protein
MDLVEENDYPISLDDVCISTNEQGEESVENIQVDQRNSDCDDISGLKVPFDKIRVEMDTKLKKCREHIAETERLHLAAVETKRTLDQKCVNVSNEQEEWKDIKAKLAKTSLSRRVVLNVGGSRYTTNIDTLTREKDTFFTDCFSRDWEQESDNHDRSIFVDRNGQIFTYILEYLRTNAVEDDVINNELLRQSLMIEARYFRLQNLINILTNAEEAIAERQRIGNTFPNSTLLEIEHKRRLNEFYGKQGQRWRLIYKASRDGFDGNAFHTRCNNQGPTMTIIRTTNNYLFGGHTAVAWASDGNYKNDTTAFLFTLINPHHIPSTKYVINPGSAGYAVYHNSNYGPCFGNSAFNLINNRNLGGSRIGFPDVYIDTTGKGNTTFIGPNSFLTSDVEVFKLA